jgi:hypothetical protein
MNRFERGNDSHTSEFPQASTHSISRPFTRPVLTVDRFVKDGVYDIVIKAESAFKRRESRTSDELKLMNISGALGLVSIIPKL